MKIMFVLLFRLAFYDVLEDGTVATFSLAPLAYSDPPYYGNSDFHSTYHGCEALVN